MAPKPFGATVGTVVRPVAYLSVTLSFSFFVPHLFNVVHPHQVVHTLWQYSFFLVPKFCCCSLLAWNCFLLIPFWIGVRILPLEICKMLHKMRKQSKHHRLWVFHLLPIVKLLYFVDGQVRRNGRWLTTFWIEFSLLHCTRWPSCGNGTTLHWRRNP